MLSMPMAPNLSNHHRDTLRKILGHPASGNVEWRSVISLMEAVGTVREEHNGKFEVTVGPETEVLHRPHGKDVDTQMILDLRRMLTEAGLIAPAIDFGSTEVADNSVLHPTGQARFVKRLFVASNSALANCLGGPNPTLTNQALSTRTAEKILGKYFDGEPFVGPSSPGSSIDDRVTQAVLDRGI
jgi:hypothetical protein